MSRKLTILLLFLIAFLFSLVFPNLIFAATFNTQISPPDIFPDTPQITIEINSDENSFSPGTHYSFLVWNAIQGENKCYVSQDIQGVQLNVTPNKITVSWEPRGCITTATGTYYFQLWAGTGTQDRNNSSLIGQTFGFTIQQPGGQEPSLLPRQQTVLLNTQPTVLISNARTGNTYTFWWDGASAILPGNIAAKKTVNANDVQGGIAVPVLLGLNGGNFKAGQASKICMELGDYNLPVTCHYSTSFLFSNVAPPTNTQCIILPSPNPTDTDDVNLSITNAAPNTNYTLDLKKDGNDFKTIPSQIVDQSGNLIIPLGTKLPQGTYATHVYVDSATSQSLDPCTKNFSVGPTGAPAPSATACTDDPAKCTSGGGQKIKGCSDPEDPSYDPKHPAIATAIGCIHTNPAELVKDFMTFVIGIGGGLAFLMMILGAFQMLTSAGNPETLQAGRDRLTSAVIGLLFVIFAVLLLQIIGVDILKIPGFGR